MNIVFFEVKKYEIPILKKEFKEHKTEFFEEVLDKNNISKIKGAEILCIFIYSNLTQELLAKLTSLKLIITRSTGYDHINMTYCRKNKIAVSNIPSYGENTVAEHAFAMLLALTRKIIEANNQVISNNISIEKLKCFDLKEKTIGIIGAGRIGQHMIKMASGFGMKVIAYDIYQNLQVAEKLGFSYVSLDELLKNSDIISIHALLTKQTNHLINESSFKKMRRGVVIINTSRGEIIEIKALVNNLKKGKIGALGLDVFEHEKILIKEKKKDDNLDYLLHHKDVLITPHMAFYSKESLQRILNSTISSIHAFIKNKPINLINV